jgi:hypothetical protein
MNNKIQQLFTESLLPSIPNGKTMRSFQRVVLSQSDSVGITQASAGGTETPNHVDIGPTVVRVDDTGRAHLVKVGTYQAEDYTKTNSL